MIEALNNIADKWFNWELAMLWQVAVLIAIIWGIDLLIRKWAWPQVRYALWLLILVKLVLPPTLTSPASFTAKIPILAQKAVKVQINQPEATPEVVEISKHVESDAIPANENIPDYTETFAEPTPGNVATQPLEAVTLSWRAYAFFVWLAGTVILANWLIIRLSNLRREHLKNQQQANLPDRFKKLLEVTARKLNLKKVPQVILTNKVCCPAVFGVFRPVLLMPADKLKNLTRQDTEHILLHELAHIKRGDLFIHAIHMILQIAYWFNPLLWLIRKQLQNLRELCCDATVAKILKEKTFSYRETLLETAKQLLAEAIDPGLGLLGLFENSNWLVDRLKWLEKKTWKNRPLRIATILILVGVMLICVLPMAKTKENQKALRGIDERLNVSDKAGELTINSLYMTSPDGKGLLANNSVTLFVGVTNNSQKELYLGFEYYTDSGTVATFFSPGASLGAQIRRVASNWQGRIEFPIQYNRFVKGGYVRITLAKCSGNQLKETTLAFLPIDSEVLHEKKYVIFPREKEKASKEPTFEKSLPNGVTVELVGVCEHPSEGKKWWRPDGSLLTGSPSDKIDVGGFRTRKNEASYEIVAKLTGPETLLSRSSTPEKWEIPQARKVGLGKSGMVNDKNGIPCLRATTAIVKNGLEKIDIEFGLAGVWEKKLTISSNESSKQKIQDTGVVINPPYEKDSNATITIKIPNKIDSKMAINITAVLKNGKVIDSAARNRNSKIRFMRSTDNYEFHGVNLSDVDHFEIYTSKYQWVKFNNVSLKPNFKSDLQVESKEVGKDNKTEPPWLGYDTQKGDLASESNPQIAIDVRVFLMPQQKPLVSGFLNDELDISSVDSAAPLMKPVQLAENQARKLEEWLSLVRGVKLIAVPRFNIIDGKSGDIRLTTNHEYISSYKDPNNASDEREPVAERLTIGTIVKITPKLQRDRETIVMNIEFSDNQIMKLELMQDKTGNEIKIPIIGTQSFNTRIAVKNNRATIIPVAGGPKKRIFLLIKATVLDSLISISADVQVEGKTEGQKPDEQREKISRLIGAELPFSVSNAKYHRVSFGTTGKIYAKFDIPVSDLKILLRQSYMLPDFPELSKDEKLRKRMQHYKPGIDWWKPDELRNPLYGYWSRGYYAPEGTNIWIHSELQICCSETDKGQMRIYIGSFSDGDIIYGLASKQQIIKDKLEQVLYDPNVIKQVAGQFFNRIKTADYDYFLNSKHPDVWKEFPIVGYYNALQGYRYPDLVTWICKTFKNNPIISVRLRNPIVSESKWPVVPYTVTLKDGKMLKGDLRFTYHSYGPEEIYGKEVVDKWLGVHGIDWNLMPESELYNPN